jgi:anti-sigma-K factor RskA
MSVHKSGDFWRAYFIAVLSIFAVGCGALAWGLSRSVIVTTLVVIVAAAAASLTIRAVRRRR